MSPVQAIVVSAAGAILVLFVVSRYFFRHVRPHLPHRFDSTVAIESVSHLSELHAGPASPYRRTDGTVLRLTLNGRDHVILLTADQHRALGDFLNKSKP